MKHAALGLIGIYVGYLEFSDDLAYWLPSWAATFDSGYVWGQVFVLAALGAIVFGTVVFLSYRALSWILD
jgi:hypothetical protein